MPSKEDILQKLEEVMDPELYISIVDLGLVYDVQEKQGNIDIIMTLTTMGCPLFSIIETDIKDKIKALDGVGKIHVDLVFDPPWSIEKMTERGKAMLGI